MQIQTRLPITCLQPKPSRACNLSFGWSVATATPPSRTETSSGPPEPLRALTGGAESLLHQLVGLEGLQQWTHACGVPPKGSC